MKKIQLSIPTPCHENWEGMKPEDKGRFCGSCQKTVIDFTSMSDRQIAEFFKKPVGSTCGRFHQDQLERPVEIPKKRIPWVKYFFQITWPAFALLLKSCGQRSEVMGKAMATESSSKKSSGTLLTTMGMFLPDITPVDSLPPVDKPKPMEPVEPPVLVGEIRVSEPIMGDTTVLPAADTMDTAVTESKIPLDTVSLRTYSDNCQQSIVMGGLSISRSIEVKKEIPLTETSKQTIESLAYPNPIKAGGQLTVLVNKKDDAIKQVQLFSSSGAVIPVQQNGSLKDKKLILTVPSSVAAGTYFLRIVSEKAQASTVKIIVLN